MSGRTILHNRRFENSREHAGDSTDKANSPSIHNIRKMDTSNRSVHATIKKSGRANPFCNLLKMVSLPVLFVLEWKTWPSCSGRVCWFWCCCWSGRSWAEEGAETGREFGVSWPLPKRENWFKCCGGVLNSIHKGEGSRKAAHKNAVTQMRTFGVSGGWKVFLLSVSVFGIIPPVQEWELLAFL